MFDTRCNPLHCPVSPAQLSTYSSLSNALLESPPQPHRFVSPHRRWLPQSVYSRCNKSGSSLTAGDERKCHPRTLSKRHTSQIVWFDYVERVMQGQGIPVTELSARSLGGLSKFIEGGEERVFGRGEREDRVIKVVVCWPGYEERVVEVDTQPGGPGPEGITRAQLGRAIGDGMKDFCMKAMAEKCTDDKWKLFSRESKRGIAPSQIYLVALVRVDGNAWQPALAIDDVGVTPIVKSEEL